MMKKKYLSFVTLVVFVSNMTIAKSDTICSASSVNLVQKSYIGYYGRCSDEAGMGYWCGQLDSKGGNLSSIIASFGTSAEYTNRFSGLSDIQLITNLYQNLFKRDADSAGLNFYLNLLTQRRNEFRSSHGGNSSGATEYALSRIALDVLSGATGVDATTINNKITACLAPPAPTCTPPSVLKNGVCVTAQTVSIQTLADQNGIDVSGMQKFRLTNYTDILTPPQTKVTGGECTNKVKVTDEIILCNAWNTNIFSGNFGKCTGTYVAQSATYACNAWSPVRTWKKYMNCEVNLNLPMAQNMKLQVVEGAVASVIKEGVEFAKNQLMNAVLYTLGESAVASVIAGFSSVGTGAYPAFVATFQTQIGPNLEMAWAAIEVYFNGLSGLVASKIPMPSISANNIEQSCGWDAEWQPI